MRTGRERGRGKLDRWLDRWLDRRLDQRYEREDDNISLDLYWSVPNSFDLVDESWVGTSLNVAARGDMHAHSHGFEGWAVVRDEQGELVWISANSSVPPPEWSNPISIEILTLGQDCVSSKNKCHPKYANVVLFDSPLDGELRCHDGRGHETEHFTYIGRSTTS